MLPCLALPKNSKTISSQFPNFVLILTALSLVLLLSAGKVYSGQVILSWDPPTTNADGTPLTDLAGYKIYSGNTSHNYYQNIDVGNVTTYTANLSNGTYYFAVTAYDTSRNESSYSNEVSKTIQTVQQYTLSITKAGTGTGTVTSSPAGINCGSNCTAAYNAGTIVTLTASPDVSSTFAGWSGGGCTGTGTCSISINANTTVTANFNRNTYAITATAGTGGTITPSGTVTVKHGASQTFTIKPNTNYDVSNVLVDGNSVGDMTTYPFTNVTANHSISASFTMNTFNLTVTKAGTGTGTVTSSPAGINCGPACMAAYNAGTVVTLTVSPNASSTFTGWSGGCTGTGTCTLTMDAEKTVTATFTLKTYAITATAGTGGTITPSGTVTVNHGANQTFTITPDLNYSVSDVLIDRSSGSSVGPVLTYIFTNVTTSHAISVSFTVSDYDSDGIPNFEEQGPQLNNANYDGNNDGIPDYLQNNVASFYTFDRTNYITLFSPDEYLLSNVTAAQVPQGAPLVAAFPYNFIEFKVNNLPPGAGTNIIIKLPEGTLINSYYKYGPTLENPTPHWYDFLFDGQTGAEISGNIITLYLIDGLRGDDDLTVNGQILDQGGPARINVLSNPGFENGTSPWVFYTNGSGTFKNDAAGDGSAHAAHIMIAQQGTNVQLYQANLVLEPNTKYMLSFKAYSNTGHDLSVSLQKHGSPYTSYGLSNQQFNLTSSWGKYSAVFTTANFSGTVNDGRLMLWLAPYATNGDQYFIDDVVLTKVVTSATPPTISTQPVNQTASVGQTATFNVMATGTAPLSYQWQKNGVNIPGVTSASYATPATTLADNGAVFRCKVTNSAGSVTSNPATLTVISAITSILSNPGFENGTSPWVFYTNGSGTFKNDAPGAESFYAGHITIIQPGTNVQLYQTNLVLEPNTKYMLSFKAYSNTGHDLSVSLQKHGSPYTSYGLPNQQFNLTSSWGKYSVEFTTTNFSGTVNDGRLMFWLAPYATNGDQYFIDDVVLTKVQI